MANSMPSASRSMNRRFILWNGEEMRSMSVFAFGYVPKNQRFTRSGNLYGEFSGMNVVNAEKET